jgi:uncharacterized membrane protein
MVLLMANCASLAHLAKLNASPRESASYFNELFLKARDGIVPDYPDIIVARDLGWMQGILEAHRIVFDWEVEEMNELHSMPVISGYDV